MFTNGFEKRANFLKQIGGTVKSMISPSTKSMANVGAKTMAPKVLATRLDKSPVTSEWGLRQGLKSGAVRYADIK